jgi:spermidine synthase
VAYLAPRITYAPDSLPRDRLVSLLRTLSLDPREILSAPIEPAVTQRLAAYWAARNLFIESGRNVRPSSRVEEMLPQVREPLLAALRLSPDFRPAYDPLLAMARALAQGDVSRGRELLEELARVQPARGDAAAALASLGAAPSGGELLSP